MFSLSGFKSLSNAVICLLIGISSTVWANEPRLAVSKSPLSLPFFVAKEKNLFARHKVAPVFVECLGGIRCVKELVEGRVDMATASELPFMFAAFQSAPISLIATFVNNKDDMKFIVRRSAMPGGLRELKGKRVGFVQKSASHYFMDLFLLYHGLDPKSIVPVPMGAEQLPEALAKGEVDAISVWEPWGHLALRAGESQVTVVEAPKLYSQTFNLMVSNAYRLGGSRNALGVLAALDEAILFIKQNPDESKQIMARHAGLDATTVKAAWPTYQFELSLKQSLLTTVQGQARWAQREGHVSPTLPEPEFLNYIDSSLLRKLKPTAVDFAYP